MKLLVPVKRVVDYAVKVAVRPDKSGVNLTGVKFSMNPFCEIAVEEAVRLKEKGQVSEITAVSIGPKQSLDTLRQAMALGADNAIHIQTDSPIDKEVQPLLVSRVLQHFIKRDSYDMVLMGKQSIDDDYNQTGQMLAGMLEWPQATFASKVEVSEDSKSVQVEREIDGGNQVLKMSFPCLITCDLRLNEPRFAGIKQIMAAKKKKVEAVKLEELGLDSAGGIEVLEVMEPPKREGGIMVASVDELLEKLRGEAKVL
jgi:electron transfer flavoprotein beta subunit